MIKINNTMENFIVNYSPIIIGLSIIFSKWISEYYKTKRIIKFKDMDNSKIEATGKYEDNSKNDKN